MSQTVTAIYEDGVFKPLQKVNIKPHQKIELTISTREEKDLSKEDLQKLVESQKRALVKFIGKGRSAEGDLSENHDKHLYPKE